MTFGLSKCATININKGKIMNSLNHTTDHNNTAFKELEEYDAYKYLGIDENSNFFHDKIKEKLKQTYKTRLRKILRTELNAKNKIESINLLALPVLRYSFGIVNWRKDEIEKLDTLTRKQLTMNRMHHPKAAVERLYMPRAEGGRGLCRVMDVWRDEMSNLASYIYNPSDNLCKIINHFDNNEPIYSNTKQATKLLSKYNIKLPLRNNDKLKLKSLTYESNSKNLKQKALHGHHETQRTRLFVDNELTNSWLKSSGLKSETEGFAFAIQDQVIKTRAYQSKILKQDVNTLCRFCGKASETLMHLVSGCEILATKEYILRHDAVANYIHWSLLKERNYKVSQHYWNHVPDKITNTKNSTIFWNQGVLTDRTVLCNKPDIIVKEKHLTNLIEVSVPHDNNVANKTREKLIKYQDLKLEIERMWKTPTVVTPVIIGHTGMIAKGFDKYINSISYKMKAVELQKIAILGTCRLVRKALQL